jgi:polyisoprenoid-binding protein YceI
MFRVSTTYTTVSFNIVKWMVLKEEGWFREFTGSIAYDPQNPAACKIDMVVQASSIDTRNHGRDDVLRADDFFNIAKYPTLEFHSTSVTRKIDDLFEVTGDLTIHGVTKRMILPVKILGVHAVDKADTVAGFESTFTIDRTAFGVLGFRWSGGQLALSKDVTIHILAGAVEGPYSA